ncbi:hypothetical protein OG21DRAFT_1515459 [Imleria badia]|nr:hypothetical protein OG21DRAFT_1515459 [Imleria badia]
MRLRANGATDDRMSPEISCRTVDLREWLVGAKNGTIQELGRSEPSAGPGASHRFLLA